jgi:hypothetical protein
MIFLYIMSENEDIDASRFFFGSGYPAIIASTCSPIR